MHDLPIFVIWTFGVLQSMGVTIYTGVHLFRAVWEKYHPRPDWLGAPGSSRLRSLHLFACLEIEQSLALHMQKAPVSLAPRNANEVYSHGPGSLDVGGHQLMTVCY